MVTVFVTAIKTLRQMEKRTIRDQYRQTFGKLGTRRKTGGRFVKARVAWGLGLDIDFGLTRIIKNSNRSV